MGTVVSARSDRQVKVIGGHISWFGSGESIAMAELGGRGRTSVVTQLQRNRFSRAQHHK